MRIKTASGEEFILPWKIKVVTVGVGTLVTFFSFIGGKYMKSPWEVESAVSKLSESAGDLKDSTKELFRIAAINESRITRVETALESLTKQVDRLLDRKGSQ